MSAVEKIPVPGETKKGPAFPAQCRDREDGSYSCIAQFGNGGQVILVIGTYPTQEAAKSAFSELKRAPKGTGRTTVPISILGQKANLYLVERAQMGGHCTGSFAYRIGNTVSDFRLQGLQKPNVGVCAGPKPTVAYLRKAVPAISKALANP